MFISSIILLQTVAEKRAWEVSKKEGFELVTIMPSLVLGPVTGTRPDGTSINAFKVPFIISSHSFLADSFSKFGATRWFESEDSTKALHAYDATQAL